MEMTEKEAYHWNDFVIWAEQNGVDLGHPDDYTPWWKCWKAGIKAHETNCHEPRD